MDARVPVSGLRESAQTMQQALIPDLQLLSQAQSQQETKTEHISDSVLHTGFLNIALLSREIIPHTEKKGTSSVS